MHGQTWKINNRKFKSYGFAKTIECKSGTPTCISNGYIIDSRETKAQKNPPALPENDKAGRQDCMFFLFCLNADKNMFIF